MNDPKSEQLGLYVEPELAAKIREAARLEARTVSGWLRYHVLRKLESLGQQKQSET